VKEDGGLQECSGVCGSGRAWKQATLGALGNVG